MDNVLYKKLRKEFTTPSFRNRLIKQLGCSCYNCGRTNKELTIEYHHVVPLIHGGTNNITNIVPLCEDCHIKAHGSKRSSKNHGTRIGRPKFKPLENYKQTLDRFLRGEIGKAECQILVGMKVGKLNDMDFYHDYLKELGIIYSRNLVDAIRTKEYPEERIVSYVVYSDGVRNDFTKGGKVIISKDLATVVRCQNKY